MSKAAIYRLAAARCRTWPASTYGAVAGGGRRRIVVASDVDNPLLGPRGAAAVFGPQKGASPTDVSHLERALTVWAEQVAEATGTDLASRAGGGAAGGLASQPWPC